MCYFATCLLNGEYKSKTIIEGRKGGRFLVEYGTY